MRVILLSVILAVKVKAPCLLQDVRYLLSGLDLLVSELFTLSFQAPCHRLGSLGRAHMPFPASSISLTPACTHSGSSHNKSL